MPIELMCILVLVTLAVQAYENLYRICVANRACASLDSGKMTSPEGEEEISQKPKLLDCGQSSLVGMRRVLDANFAKLVPSQRHR